MRDARFKSVRHRDEIATASSRSVTPAASFLDDG
jgi:hypothetical protein